MNAFRIGLLFGFFAVVVSRKLTIMNVRKFLRRNDLHAPLEINHSLIKKYYMWSFQEIDRMQATHDGTLDRFVEIDLQQRVLSRYVETMNNLFTRDEIYDHIALQNGCDNVNTKLVYLNKTFGRDKSRDEFLFCVRDLYRMSRLLFLNKNNYSRTRNWLAKYIASRSGAEENSTSDVQCLE
jgi:hypothetical protein